MLHFVALVILGFLAYRHVRGRWRRDGLSLPPGPPADPLIGHFRMLPTHNPQDKFYQWAKVYGDVMRLHFLGQTTIILSSEEAAKELLDKRGVNYSERPSFPLLEGAGWGTALSFTSYSDPLFSRRRKFSQQPFIRQSVISYEDLEIEESSVLLMNLAEHPETWRRHLHQYTTGVILRIFYGRRILSNDDGFLQTAGRIVPILRKATRRSLLDISPWFKLLPRWFPGAWFIQSIEEMRPVTQEVMDYPMDVVLEEMAAGTAQPSIMLSKLEEASRNDSPDAEEIRFLRDAGFHTFSAAQGTSWHTLSVFVLCMVLNPEAQGKGQEEIDRVVGANRLPDFSDRDALPYVECILRETMRMYPVAPVGLPHMSVADDEYRGMFIPAGSTIIANGRAMTLDERKFCDPHKFMPERFLPKPEGRGEVLPESVVFGWGRRICPGRHLADATVWLAVARMLAVFDFRKPTDSNGKAYDPTPKFETTVTCHPEPFPCTVVPRSGHSKKLVQEAYQHTYHAAHFQEDKSSS